MLFHFSHTGNVPMTGHPWIRRTALLAVTGAIVVLAACAPIKGGAGAAQLPFGSAHPQAQELYYLVNNERAANRTRSARMA